MGTSQLDIEGNSNNGLPIGFAIYPNFPNPFNPITQIRYDLPKDNLVNITLYDIQGRKIRTLINIYQVAGYHSIHWDSKNDLGGGVAAGMYIYSIQADKFRATKKMVLLK
ncbi:MAG: T9SS type A sorting domain-containing protein [Candidatus Neomarinimicrobiota bacterium]